MDTVGADRARAPRALGGAARKGRAGLGGQQLEARILLTSTMCLLAFGAVMVYSASSATTLLQGRGYGSSYLVKYLIYGSICLVALRLLGRDGSAQNHHLP